LDIVKARVRVDNWCFAVEPMDENSESTSDPVGPVGIEIDYARPQPAKRLDLSGVIAVAMVLATFAIVILLPLTLISRHTPFAFLWLLVILGAGCVISGTGTMWRRRQERVYPWQAKLAVFLGLPALVLGMLAIIPSGEIIYRHPNRLKCQKNLLAIGQAIQLYSSDHGGRFPGKLDELITFADVSPEVFICPHGNDRAAAGATMSQIVADFAKPGQCSYRYVGGSLSGTKSTFNHVLAYEPLDKHEGIGANFLMGDFSVQWLSDVRAEKWIRQLEAGVNPPVP
jgi:hypothetical protein